MILTSVITQAFQRIFGSKNSRELKRMSALVARINSLSDEVSTASADGLKKRTDELRTRAKSGVPLDTLLPEAFALVREAAGRSIGQRHYDVQLIGGIALHEGCIAEMRTGEGKTLVATLAAYLNALPGEGVHIVTVNDYLARRDAEWMGPIFKTLGMSVGVIQSGEYGEAKAEAYQADVIYGTNNEFGFDYLRDNMAFRLQDRVQRSLHYAIVDEVDSILIDEARTPLIIVGAAEESTELYMKINKLAPKLKQQEKIEQDLASRFGGEEIEETGDFFIDEKSRSAELTERGHLKVEEELVSMGLLEEGDSLYTASNLSLLHHVLAALKAHYLYKRDVEYMVRDGEIVIIDESTGRAMHGRRWSDGIHQAVEAKEGVAIRRESQTLASTTYQNYFRLYAKLAGMTGTADTEAFEFRQIYGLSVIVIPTHRPMIRDDRNDLIYQTLEEKYDAIVEDILESIENDRPVLVGTTSVDGSERLSKELRKRKIKHNVLNAKQHEREAEIVAQAGQPAKVTIATNMAGRGTDIVLGGNWQVDIQHLDKEIDSGEIERNQKAWAVQHKRVVDTGGLHIIGTERHESRRVDNQLRGRAGRQGDPGSSRFYLSMEDSLMRIFVTDRIRSMISTMRLERGEAIESKMVNNAIERAQRKVESRNFDIRKNLLEYDNVLNDQRQVIFQQRYDLMTMTDIQKNIEEMMREALEYAVDDYLPPQSISSQWDIEGLENSLNSQFTLQIPMQRWVEEEDELTEEEIKEKIIKLASERYTLKRERWFEEGIDADALEKHVVLTMLDQKWKEHLATMDHVRQGIHLRAYAQKQPKQEYQREAFELFQKMMLEIQHDSIRMLFRVEVGRHRRDQQEEELLRRRSAATQMRYLHADESTLEGSNEEAVERPTTYVRQERKVGRNETCPCGSGKKFKHCHGKAA